MATVSSWQDQLRAQVLCNFWKGPFSEVGSFQNAICWDALEPELSKRKSLTFAECDELTKDSSRPVKTGHLRQWIITTLPKDATNLSASDEEILALWPKALMHSVRESIDLILSLKTMASQSLALIDSMAGKAPEETQKKLDKTRETWEKIIHTDNEEDANGFVVVNPLQHRLMQEIQLLEQWKKDPKQLLDLEAGQEASKQGQITDAPKS